MKFFLGRIRNNTVILSEAQRNRGPQRQVFVAGVWSRRTCIFFGLCSVADLSDCDEVQTHLNRSVNPPTSSA